jgi:nitroreductase
MVTTTQTAQETIHFLEKLRAVRQYSTQPVSDEVIQAILKVARWSGSANNAQEWEFVVVRNKETLQKIAETHGYVRHVSSAAFAIIVVMEGNTGNALLECFDEGRVSERLMLAAHAYGVGSCIGWSADEGAGIKELLGIPQERFVRTTIAFGYPDEEAMRNKPKRPQARKELSEIVHTEQYKG